MEGEKDCIKVSVLMPVYNASEFLREAIDSILDQTFPHFEFVIVNDGSTDDSDQIIDSYIDRRIKHIKLESNGGIVKALNAGLGLVSGEYIVRMDADDVSVPDRLMEQVDFMDNNPDIGVAGSWVKYFGQRHGIMKQPKAHNEILWTLLVGTTMFHPSVIMRSSLFFKNNIRYSTEFPHAEDYALWSVLCMKTKFANIPKPLLNYRWSPRSVTALNSIIQKETSDRVRRLVHEQLYGTVISDSDWESLGKESKSPIAISVLIKVYSGINHALNLFAQDQFMNKLDLRIKQLVLFKRVDGPSRIWLLKRSCANISFLKYFLISLR